MADSDEPRGDAPAGDDLSEAFLEPGPRRSTYRPPAHIAQPPVPAPAPEASLEPEPEPEPTPEPEPPALPPVPERRSLTDQELTEELSDATEQAGSSLEALDVLESQLRLRLEEAEEYRDWEQTMRSIGTPDALATVESVRPTFDEVVAITTSIPIQRQDPPALIEPPPAPSAFVEPEVAAPPVAPPTIVWPSFSSPVAAEPEPEPEPEPETAPQPEPEPETAPELEPEPEPQFPIESFAPSAPFDFDALFAAQNPTPAIETEPTSDPLADLPEPIVASDPVDDVAPLTFVEPTSPVVAPVVAPVASPASFSFDALLEPEPAGESAPAFGDLLLTPPPAPGSEPLAGAEPLVVGTTPSAAAPAAPAAPVEYVPVVAGFAAEEIGPLPTPFQQRAGRAVQMFWLWFAANSSVVSVAFGAILFSLGMSLRQAVIATLIGVVLSFLPLGLGTLAGKRSGQPTMIVSRATFGLRGNILPAVIALVSRVFWGSALLWLLGASTASALVGAGVTGGLGESKLVILAMGIAFILALLVAFFGFRVIAVFQLVVSILSVVLIAGLIWLTWPSVDFDTALTTPDGSLTLVLTGAVLVFSFIGLVWANSAGDLARYQRTRASSARSSLWASFGTTLPTFVLIAYGALLAASDKTLAAGLLSNPVGTIGSLLPAWYPIPLVAAVALSLLSGVVVSIYSGSFAVAATGLRMKQTVSTLLVAVLVFVVGWLISTVGTDLLTLFRDLATTIAVPVATWVGLFAAEIMIRNRRYDAAALLTPGGRYPAVRWLNLGALVVVSAIGYGLTTATLPGLGWQGYILTLAGVGGDVAASDFGVLVALVLGLIVPLAFGIGAIRRQEAADSVA